MPKVVAVTQALKTLNDVENRLGVTRQDDRSFFAEWQADLPGFHHGTQ